MTEIADAERAQTDNLYPEKPDRSQAHENRADSGGLALSGPLCRFKHADGVGEAEVNRLAELQHGHVHISQLRAAGIGRSALSHRVRTGRLHRTLPGVYLVGPQRWDLRGRMMAAALYFRGHGVISRRAAAHLWGLLDTTEQLEQDDTVDVLLVDRSPAYLQGVWAHRCKALTPQDVRWRDGIPVTSPARTLLDLAGCIGDIELESALSRAFHRNLVRTSQLNDVIARNPRAQGIAQLRVMVAEPHALHDTRSKYERKLLRLLMDAELPLPETNVRVGGRMVDAYWRQFGLVIEVDGWQYHRSRQQFEEDRLRDQGLFLAGNQVMRVTTRQIDRRPYALIARIVRTLVKVGWGEPCDDIPW